jgi:hypothetical protein
LYIVEAGAIRSISLARVQIWFGSAFSFGLSSTVFFVGGFGVSATSLDDFKENAIEGSVEIFEEVRAKQADLFVSF